MRYYGIIRSEQYLAHHGIKGQHWGVRNGPPYPLDRQKKTGVDHKTNNTKINKARASLALNVALAVATGNPFAAIDAVKQGVGAVSAVKRTNDVDKALGTNTSIDKKTGFKIKQKQMSGIEDLKMVNPGFHNLQDNSKNNCMLCTTTYDLRRRGYDVTANKAAVGYTNNDLRRWYPNVEIKRVLYQDSLKERFTHKNLIASTKQALISQGEGARGNIMVRWQQTFGGHSMAYEITGGNLVILDAQANKVYRNPDSILKRVMSVEYARLDNVKPNWKEIKECARS